MKKLLLSASLVLSSLMLSAQATLSVDPATYDEVDGYKLQPLWGWYTGIGNENYGTVGAGSRGMAITKDGTKVLIPHRKNNIHTDIYIEIYDAKTGEHLKSLPIDKAIWDRGTKVDAEGNTVPNVSEWNANDIAVDDAGNVLLWKMIFNLGTGVPEVFAVDLETGGVKSIEINSIESAEGRFDYFAVSGDIVNGDGYILSPTSNGDETWGKTVAKWNYKGGKLVPTTLDDLIFITEYYPKAAVSNSTGTRVGIVNDDLFYLDGFNTYATLYNMADGTIADSFGSIADAEVRKGIEPLATGNNGIAEFKNGGTNFAIFSISNQLQTPMTALRLVSLNDNMEFSSMKALYNVPKDGMGDISNGERTVLPKVISDPTTGLSRIVIYCNRGGAVAYDFGKSDAIDAVYGTGIAALNGDKLEITVDKGEVILSEVGNIEVYSIAGEKIADKFLATSIKLLPGLYVVKATNASGTVTSKVIVK